MRKLLLCLFLLTTVFLYSSGKQEQSAEKAGPKAITMLSIPEFTSIDGFSAVIAEWEKRTGNTIEVQILPDDQVNQALVQRLNAGEGPDLFETSGKGAEFYLPPNSVEPLNDRPWAGEIPAATLELMTYTDGTLPYVPIIPLNAAGVAYNKKIFTELGLSEPKNRLEFVAVMEKIKEAGMTALLLQGAPGFSWNLRHWMDPMFAYYDKHLAAPNHWEKLNSNELKFSEVDFYVQSMQNMRDYIEAGYTNDDILSVTLNMTLDRFAHGEAVMVCFPELIVGPIRQITPDFEFGFFPLPMVDDKEGVLASFVGFGMSVWKGGKSKDTVLDFIDFMCSKEMQELFYTITPGTPIFPYADVPLTPVGEVIREHVNRNNASPRLMINDKLFLQPVYDKLLQSLATGDKTPREILASYDDERKRAGQQRGVPGF